MIVVHILFWLCVFCVLYSYAGYGMLIIVINKLSFLKKLLPPPSNAKPLEYSAPEGEYFPQISLIISASGETKEIIQEKIRNTYDLIYPKDKIEVIFAIAFDTSSEADETINEYYNHFLATPGFISPGIKDEELYAKFSYVDKTADLRNPEVLAKIEKELEGTKVHSGEIQPGSKEVLDKMFSPGKEEELNIRITKDIERKGKISQVNRTVKIANGEIIVFSDCNSMFNKESLINISRHFRNKQVGCVAGEKRVRQSEKSTSGEGEGLYWKYESLLKKLDSKIWTTVGAAGEIFAVRKELWGDRIEENAIIEDFLISMRIAGDGYRVIYEPDAYAEEDPTTSLKDEYVRRRRIAAGGFQSIVWLKYLLNPLKYRVLTFQYISHRVLRWAVVPFILPLILILNVIILVVNFDLLYFILFLGQLFVYFLAAVGYFLEQKRIKIKVFYIPYLLMMMNWSAYVGLKRYLKGQQKVVWERAKR